MRGVLGRSSLNACMLHPPPLPRARDPLHVCPQALAHVSATRVIVHENVNTRAHANPHPHPHPHPAPLSPPPCQPTHRHVHQRVLQIGIRLCLGGGLQEAHQVQHGMVLQAGALAHMGTCMSTPPCVPVYLCVQGLCPGSVV